MPRKRRPTVRLDHAVAEFFKVLESERMSKSILTGKEFTLRFLIKSAGAHRYTRNLTKAHFEQCLDDLAKGGSAAENLSRQQRGKTPRTGRRPSVLAADRTNLRQFVKFCIAREWMDPGFDPLYRITASNRPAGDLPSEKIWRGQHVPIEQWPALLNATESPRDRLVLAIGLGWGVRASTLVGVQVKDLDMETNTIALFNTKKGRWETTERRPIGKLVERELATYLPWYENNYGSLQPEWYLTPVKVSASNKHLNINTLAPAEWPLDPTRQMNSRTVRDITRKALKNGLGWTTILGEGAHTLRRSASVAVEEYGGLDAAMALLDHKAPTDTIRYTRNAAGRRRLEETLAKIDLPGQREPEPDPEPEAGHQDRLAEVIDLFSRRKVG